MHGNGAVVSRACTDGSNIQAVTASDLQSGTVCVCVCCNSALRVFNLMYFNQSSMCRVDAMSCCAGSWPGGLKFGWYLLCACHVTKLMQFLLSSQAQTSRTLMLSPTTLRLRKTEFLSSAAWLRYGETQAHNILGMCKIVQADFRNPKMR